MLGAGVRQFSVDRCLINIKTYLGPSFLQAHHSCINKDSSSVISWAVTMSCCHISHVCFFDVDLKISSTGAARSMFSLFNVVTCCSAGFLSVSLPFPFPVPLGIGVFFVLRSLLLIVSGK